MPNDQKSMISVMPYPGRLIMIGQDKSGKKIVVFYAVTGRSPSSQARKMTWEKDSLWVKPTDREIIKKGNIDLLIYPALFVLPQGLAVSNGKHTVDIMASLNHSRNASEVLAFSLQKWDYEPDEPAFTPRISGCVLSSGSAALGIIKRAENGDPIRNIFEFPLMRGKGKLIATYSGRDTDPLPSFEGEPLEIDIKNETPIEAAEMIYAAMAPAEKNRDFRVAAACFYVDKKQPETFVYHIINRQERTS